MSDPYVVSDSRLAEIRALLNGDTGYARRGVTVDALAGAVYDLLAERDTPPIATEKLEHDDLISRLGRWADARERRNGPGGHGATGTALLREAAAALARLEPHEEMCGCGHVHYTNRGCLDCSCWGWTRPESAA